MPLGATEVRTDALGDEYTVFLCSTCEEEHEVDYYAADCCTWECGNCGRIHESEGGMMDCCPYSCDMCGQGYSDGEDAEYCCEEERESQSVMNPDYPDSVHDAIVEHTLYVPAMENRPARICSVEQELSRGGAAVASMLYNIGLSQRGELMNYTFEGYPGQAIVKTDGSLRRGGGEVVYSRFNLGDLVDSQRVSKALACIQALEEEGIVEVGTDAGTHIHISALDIDNRPFGPAQIASCYEIFSFGEDVIFRMGAAGWHQHRGQNYTRIMPKFNHEEDGITPSKVAKQSQRERYFSLNFRRLLNAVQSCRCGACIMGDWASCDCGVLQTGTIEWRVFNATTNPETLHAWLLLAHGITAASFEHTIGTLNPHGFGDTDPELHPWIFGWLLWNCPYEDSERQILFNTARRSPGLNLPWENIDLFHSGWEAMELPEALPEPVLLNEGMQETDVPAEDGSFEGCNCNTCRRARERLAMDDEGFISDEALSTVADVSANLQSFIISNTQWTTTQSPTYVTYDTGSLDLGEVEVPEFIEPSDNPDIPF